MSGAHAATVLTVNHPTRRKLVSKMTVLYIQLLDCFIVSVQYFVALIWPLFLLENI